MGTGADVRPLAFGALIEEGATDFRPSINDYQCLFLSNLFCLRCHSDCLMAFGMILRV